MAEFGYHQLVDVHGELRNRALAAFRLIPQLADLSDAELLNASWPVWRLLVADLLDATDCPNCLGAGDLDDSGTPIECPTCGGDGWQYGAKFVEISKAPRDDGLPPPLDGRTDPTFPARPTRPKSVDAAAVDTRTR